MMTITRFHFRGVYMSDFEEGLVLGYLIATNAPQDIKDAFMSMRLANDVCEEPPLNNILDAPVIALDLDARTRNVIHNFSWDYGTGQHDELERIETVRDVVRKTERDFLKTPNFGRKSLKRLNDELAIHGLRLGMDV